MKILILIKPFKNSHPKHTPKFNSILAIKKFADVRLWYENGDLPNILSILSESNFVPDFIFHYDIAWNYALAPKITGLSQTKIPKGAFVIDLHFNKAIRSSYIKTNKIDLIFSTYKHPFLNTFPEFKDRFRWMPWSINPDIFQDWTLKKDINYLLMGLTNKKYNFRSKVLEIMKNEEKFVHHPHPGHSTKDRPNIFLNEKYAREINRAKIFYTCGSKLEYSVQKFFEIPACRTLLLAEPCRDIVDLGFKDGVNFVECSQSNILTKSKYYLENEEERIRITNAGYDFIHTYHTDDARAKQFVQHVENLLKTRKNPS